MAPSERRLDGLSSLLPALVLAGLGWSRRWVAEDAFIALRVVDNLLGGYGPVFNVGERVEAFTSPLWLGVLAGTAGLLRALPVDGLAAGLGLLGAVGGLVAAAHGALRAVGTGEGGGGRGWPLGALVVAVLPPFWDFATSGLETGLALGWLGSSFLGLARLSAGEAGRPVWLAVLIGLAPLVRPDLALVGAGFLGLLFLFAPRAGGPGLPRLVAAAVALPLAYQIFRMGYFAALVSNTAIAKEAFSTHWAQGWRYLGDFMTPYWFWAPALPLLAAWTAGLATARRGRRWRTAALFIVPVVCGLLHATYVVRLGGDFMHGRLLLPSLFTMLLPVMAVRVERRRPSTVLTVAVVPWAIVCALWLRVPYAPSEIGPDGIADERGFYAAPYGEAALTFWAQEGRILRRLAGEHRALLLGDESFLLGKPPAEAPLASGVVADVVVGRINIGRRGYAAGPRVHLVDRHGIADPVAARLRLARRGRPGHEKVLADAWLVARFADPAASLLGGEPSPQAVAGARAALGCGSLRTLIDAVETPLTTARFLANVGVAWRLRGLMTPPDPDQAAGEFCAQAR